MSLSRRQFGSAVAASLGATFLSTQARATTLLALSLQELQNRSAKVALATPQSSSAAWEYVGGERRIVTTTRALLHEVWLDQPSDDAPADSGQELHLVTLGGRVGDLQQRVFGEAHLTHGEPCLLFTSRAQNGLRRVVGMAQGHYPLREDAGVFHLRPSPNLPPLEPPPRSVPAAVDTLRDLELSQARRLLGGRR